MPKVGIKLVEFSCLLPESFAFASARILVLVSFLFVAVVNPFDPCLPLIFKFLSF